MGVNIVERRTQGPLPHCPPAVGYNHPMSEDVLLSAIRTVMARCDVSEQAPLVVGVSGGPDSVALLDALRRLGYAVVAAHYHHGLRAAADADAAAVQALAGRLGVPFVMARGDVITAAARRGESVETAARAARYRFLFAAASQQRAVGVAVGHTADDQVETVLHHLLRGSGLRGLHGLRPCRVLPSWSPTMPLLRPLLEVTRADTIAYCRARGLPLRWDASNWQRHYTRNRLRLDILPRLRVENPAVDVALRRLAEIAAAEEDFVAGEALRHWPDVVAYESEAAVAFWRMPFLKAHPALQRRWLVMAGERLSVGEAGFASVEVIREGARRPRGGLHPWNKGLFWWAEPRRLWLLSDATALPPEIWPQLPSEDPFPLSPQATLPLRGGWQLAVTPPQVLPDSWRSTAGLATPWLDAAELRFPLSVRPPRPGDRMAPLGMKGHHRKVADLLAESGVPRPLRARWPLVCTQNEIAWIPLVAVAHRFRITPTTTQAVSLTLFFPGGT